MGFYKKNEKKCLTGMFRFDHPHISINVKHQLWDAQSVVGRFFVDFDWVDFT